MPRLTIVGATGPTGRLVSRALADSGHPPTVLIRNEGRKAEFEALGARVIIADAMESAAMHSAMTAAVDDSDTVLNLLGGNPFMDPETWPDLDGVINTTEAAVEAGFRRCLLVTSVGTGKSWQYVPEDAYIRPILELKTAAEEHLKASGLDWTIIKPGGLGPPDFHVKRGAPLITENHGVRGLIDREDLAEVIMRVLAAPPEKVLRRELYAVTDRIELHDGNAVRFQIL
jgi:uncharacterized protein YbjT (DUF2867 family)